MFGRELWSRGFGGHEFKSQDQTSDGYLPHFLLNLVKVNEKESRDGPSAICFSLNCVAIYHQYLPIIRKNISVVY